MSRWTLDLPLQVPADNGKQGKPFQCYLGETVEDDVLPSEVTMQQRNLAQDLSQNLTGLCNWLGTEQRQSSHWPALILRNSFCAARPHRMNACAFVAGRDSGSSSRTSHDRNDWSILLADFQELFQAI